MVTILVNSDEELKELKQVLTTHEFNTNRFSRPTSLLQKAVKRVNSAAH